MSSVLLISDAAKKVKVEAHVLRYWEEELALPIKRNELGHRYYTEEDVNRFLNIKDLKERGLQLKAIKLVLKNGKLDVLTPGLAETSWTEQIAAVQPIEREVLSARQWNTEKVPVVGIPEEVSDRQFTEKDSVQIKDSVQEKDSIQEKDSVQVRGNSLQLVEPEETALRDESQAEKMQRLKWLLKQLFQDTLEENNASLCLELKENIAKELDYQFRMFDEKEEERSADKKKREEEHYKKIDELLRKKRRRI